MKTKRLLCLSLSALVCLNITLTQAGNHKSKHNKGYQHGNSLPHGLQKKQARGQPLPPGWHKKLHKGDILDDDLYHRAVPVGHTAYERYHVRHGEIALRLEGKVIRLLKATRKIVEILDE